MPRSARPWFRVYSEMFTDPKMARFTPAQCWLWVAILAAASESPRRGYLLATEFEPSSVRDLSKLARVRPSLVENTLPKMVDLGMLAFDDELKAYYLINWDNRQFESDTSRDRTAQWRRQKASLHRGNAVTTGLVVTPPETETETPLPPVRHANGAAPDSAGREEFLEKFAAAWVRHAATRGAVKDADALRAWVLREHGAWAAGYHERVPSARPETLVDIAKGLR